YVCPSTHPVFATETTPGVAPIVVDRIAADIEVARERLADVVVVCLHWGAEQVGYPKPDDIHIAREIARLGVDLLVGHHAHCRQPLAKIGGMTACFGVGNAYFPDFSYEVAPGVEAWGKQRYWNRRGAIVDLDV